MRYLGLFPLLFLFVLVGMGGSASDMKILKVGAGKRDYKDDRERMVQKQIRGRGIRDGSVIGAMLKVPRHLFVPESERTRAYADGPLPIGKAQTISQPYIVALMTEALRLSPEDRVLEVGTGSGYQAAILGEIVREVYTIEIIPELGNRARALLHELGYKNIRTRIGDGYLGWPEEAPFDAIMVTAAPESIPPPLIDQLKPGGRLCIPVGPSGLVQSLLLVTNKHGGIHQETLIPVRFVPLVHPE